MEISLLLQTHPFHSTVIEKKIISLHRLQLVRLLLTSENLTDRLTHPDALYDGMLSAPSLSSPRHLEMSSKHSDLQTRIIFSLLPQKIRETCFRQIL